MKMALACALPYRPKLLILDEPFSGLDPLVRDEFMAELLQQAGEMTILISSHGLGEIDGVATHVAFIEEGRLLFQEGMSELTDRFREVRVTLEQQPCSWEQLPKSWLQVRATGNVLTFVETQFSEENLAERIQSLFVRVAPSMRSPWPSALSLRRWRAGRGTVRFGQKAEKGNDLAHFQEGLEAALAVCSGRMDRADNVRLDAIRHGLQRESNAGEDDGHLGTASSACERLPAVGCGPPGCYSGAPARLAGATNEATRFAGGEAALRFLNGEWPHLHSRRGPGPDPRVSLLGRRGASRFTWNLSADWLYASCFGPRGAHEECYGSSDRGDRLLHLCFRVSAACPQPQSECAST